MHQSADFQRTVIIGNSGSGKSWLAERLAHNLSVSAIDLDLIHWEPGSYNVKRGKSLAIQMVRQHSEGRGWVIEGVYGWLAQEALPNASALVWLDIDERECISNLKQRGPRRGGDETSFIALLTWARDYRVRDGSTSFHSHECMFLEFSRSKAVLRSRSDMAEFVNQFA